MFVALFLLSFGRSIDAEIVGRLRVFVGVNLIVVLIVRISIGIRIIVFVVVDVVIVIVIVIVIGGNVSVEHSLHPGGIAGFLVVSSTSPV